jgi:hypothetical protein
LNGFGETAEQGKSFGEAYKKWRKEKNWYWDHEWKFLARILNICFWRAWVPFVIVIICASTTSLHIPWPAVEGTLTFEAIPGYLSKSSSCSDMLILYRLCFDFFLTRILRNCRNPFYPLSYSLRPDISEG